MMRMAAMFLATAAIGLCAWGGNMLINLDEPDVLDDCFVVVGVRQPEAKMIGTKCPIKILRNLHNSVVYPTGYEVEVSVDGGMFELEAGVPYLLLLFRPEGTNTPLLGPNTCLGPLNRTLRLDSLSDPRIRDVALILDVAQVRDEPTKWDRANELANSWLDRPIVGQYAIAAMARTAAKLDTDFEDHLWQVLDRPEAHAAATVRLADRLMVERGDQGTQLAQKWATSAKRAALLKGLSAKPAAIPDAPIPWVRARIAVGADGNEVPWGSYSFVVADVPAPVAGTQERMVRVLRTLDCPWATPNPTAVIKFDPAAPVLPAGIYVLPISPKPVPDTREYQWTWGARHVTLGPLDEALAVTSAVAPEVDDMQMMLDTRRLATLSARLTRARRLYDAFGDRPWLEQYALMTEHAAVAEVRAQIDTSFHAMLTVRQDLALETYIAADRLYANATSPAWPRTAWWCTSAERLALFQRLAAAAPQDWALRAYIGDVLAKLDKAGIK